MLLSRIKDTPEVEDPEIARKIEQRLIELLFQTSEFAIYSLVAVSFLVWWSLTLNHGFPYPTIWLGAYNGLVLLRLYHIRRFFDLPVESRNYDRNAGIFWIGAVLAALFWSSAILFFLLSGNNQFLVFYALVTGGIASVGVSSLAHLPKIYLTFLACMLIPLSTYYISIGDLEHSAVGYTSLLFILFGAVVAGRFRRNVLNSITLELTNTKLAETLTAENCKAEQLNQSLLAEMDKRAETERDLMVAIDEARAASKAKSDFLAVISHEIRTPMNGILGMLDLVTDTEMSKLQRDYLETANRSAETLLRLLNDLLDFSKCDQGNLPLEQSAFLLREATEEVISLMAGRAKKKGLNFAFYWDDSAPEWVSGDPIRYRQILGNLIGNAVKFTLEGEVRVSLAQFQREEDRIRFFIEVEDTGIGIAPEDKKHLFEPFTQVDSSMTRKYGGSGLGLAISRQLVQMMGGDIQVRSEANVGSCFSFDLLLAEPGAYEIEKKVEQNVDADGEHGLSGRVLVVEDDPVNQRVIRLLLERLGLEVCIAENGQVGYETAIRENWDSIFMDCHMPVMDGILATTMIRDYERQHSLSKTPIIALTANAKDTAREACSEAGMDDFLAKPVRKTALAEVLTTWLPEKCCVNA